MAGIEDFSKVMPGVGDAVSAASGLVGALDSAFGWSQKRQQKMQKDLMDKQQDQWKEQQNILSDQQLEQWNRENEYNDPTNYYKRLLEGADKNGITKAGVLGDSAPGGTVGQSATGVSAPGSPSMTSTSGAPSFNIGQGVMSSMRHVAEIANIEADTNLKNEQAGLVPVTKQLNEALSQVYSKNLEVMDQDIALKIAEEDDRRASASLKRAQESFTKAQELLVKTQEVKEQKQIDKLVKEIERLELDNNVVREYGLAQAKAQLEVTKNTALLQLAEKAVSFALAKKYGLESAMQKMQNGTYMQTMKSLVKKAKGEAEVAHQEGRYAGAYQANQVLPGGVINDTLRGFGMGFTPFASQNMYWNAYKELMAAASSE